MLRDSAITCASLLIFVFTVCIRETRNQRIRVLRAQITELCRKRLNKTESSMLILLCISKGKLLELYFNIPCCTEILSVVVIVNITGTRIFKCDLKNKH